MPWEMPITNRTNEDVDRIEDTIKTEHPEYPTLSPVDKEEVRNESI